MFQDRTISLLCITVFLSYLPEAGQYSCFFVYLKLIVGFSQQQVAYFIAYVGILSCICQAAILVVLIKYFGSKQSIIIGLAFQVLQLTAYAFCAQSWLIWFAGLLAAISSIGYPAISAYISNNSHADQQGVSQGMVTGIRGLCNGIGPALYGFVFWIFRVSLNETNGAGGPGSAGGNLSSDAKVTYASTHLLPGPPFLFGAVLATMAIFVTWLIPSPHTTTSSILLQTSGMERGSTSGAASTSAAAKQKESTIVKLGNSSATYNRTGSGASLLAPLVSHKINESNVNSNNNNNGSSSALLVESNGAIINESLTSDFLSYKNLQEKESLLHHNHHKHHLERDTDASETQLLLNSAASTLSMSLPTTSSMATVQTVTTTLSMVGDLAGNGGLVERSATPPQQQQHNFNPYHVSNSNPTATNNSVGASGLINQAFTNTLGKQPNLSLSSGNVGTGVGIVGAGSSSNVGLISVGGASNISNSTSHVVYQTLSNVKFKLNLD